MKWRHSTLAIRLRVRPVVPVATLRTPDMPGSPINLLVPTIDHNPNSTPRRRARKERRVQVGDERIAMRSENSAFANA